jgi:hypothetical protein
MQNTWFNIRQIVFLVLFLLAFSAMGMVTGNPLMVLVYGVFLAAVSGIMYLVIRKQQSHNELRPPASKLPMLITGFAFMVIAIAIPVLVIMFSNMIPLPSDATMVTYAIVLALTIVFIALMSGAIYLINILGTDKVKRMLGFALVFLAALIPGIVMSRVDMTASSIGTVYYVALAVLIFTYSGFGLISRNL